jgi:hydroxyethylthiazole kinase-like uncharacterized protein yjeF
MVQLGSLLSAAALHFSFILTTPQQQYAANRNTCSLVMSSMSKSSTISTGYLTASEARDLDQELFQTFALEQLMELAGLSVAEAVYAVLKNSSDNNNTHDNSTKVLLVCGPGNNGGDGLVAARHLQLFGVQATVVTLSTAKQPHVRLLLQQCQNAGVVVLHQMPEQLEDYSVIVDAVFGFSFTGEPREPYKTVLQQIQTAQTQFQTNMTVVSVDVPSGWNVNDGDVANGEFVPDVLVSLTAPKQCAKTFTGRHFVGGRFLPPALADKYKIRMPNYPGVAQVVELL